jgi:hypothetical protein
VGQLECLLGACGVVELAVGVVVSYQQPQARPTRFQIRTGFSGPSSRTSAWGWRTIEPPWPSSFQASETLQPNTGWRAQ